MQNVEPNGEREWQAHWRWCGDVVEHDGHQHNYETDFEVGITWCPGYPQPVVRGEVVSSD